MVVLIVVTIFVILIVIIIVEITPPMPGMHLTKVDCCLKNKIIVIVIISLSSFLS